MAADDRDAFGVNGAGIADRAVWDEGLQRADPTSTETSNDHYGSSHALGLRSTSGCSDRRRQDVSVLVNAGPCDGGPYSVCPSSTVNTEPVIAAEASEHSSRAVGARSLSAIRRLRGKDATSLWPPSWSNQSLLSSVRI